MKTTKKLLSVLLSALLLLSMLPMAALPVLASSGDVVSIEAENLTVIQYTNGYWDGYWDADADEYVENSWYYYYAEADMLTVTYADGSVYTGDFWDVVLELGYDSCSYDDGQSYETPWGLGDHTVTAQIGDYAVTYTVTVVESPVASIVADPVSIVEYTHGYWTERWDEDTQSYVDVYYYNDYNTTLTVTMKDGSVITGNYWDIEEATGYYLEFSCEVSQYSEPWGLGDHTATVRFMGASAEYTVTITESPVASIVADPVSIVEHTHGYWNERWDEDTQSYVDVYYYDDYDTTLTVTLKDGTVITGDRWEIEEATGYYPEFFCEVSQYSEPWGLGDHTAIVRFMGASAEYTVTITQSPVVSVTAADITLTEGKDGYWSSWSYTDENGNAAETTIFMYEYTPVLTVRFRDGSVFTSTADELYELTGEWASIEDDQYYDNPWGVGDHTATVSFMGYTVDISVTVEPTPVASVVAEDLSTLPENNGYWSERWDEDTQSNVDCYVYDIDTVITVTYKDGTVITGDEWDIYNATGYWPSFFEETAQYKNPWSVGDYTATVWFMGVSDDYTVTIEESPVAAIAAQPIELIENYDGWWDDRWDEESGTYIENVWFNYSFVNDLTYTLTMKDGTVFEGDYWDVYHEVGAFPQIIDDQSYETPWDLGAHTATISLMGAKSTVDVTVVKSPVASITATVEPLTKNIDGWWSGYWDENNAYVSNAWFHYSYDDKLIYTVTMRDGTVITGDGDAISNALGVYPSSTDDQSYESAWVVGTHTVTVSLLGTDGEATVTVQDNPVAGVEVLSGPDRTTYRLNELVDLRGMKLRVHFADGTYEDVTLDHTIGFVNSQFGYTCEVHGVTGTVSLEEYWLYETGKQTVHFSLFGHKVSTEVTVLDSELTDFSLSESGDAMTVTLTYSDGTTVKATALGFYHNIGDGDTGWMMYGDTLITDNGTYQLYVKDYHDGGMELWMYDSDDNRITVETDDIAWLQRRHALWEAVRDITGYYTYKTPAELVHENGLWVATVELTDGRMLRVKLNEDLSLASYEYDPSDEDAMTGDVTNDGIVDMFDAFKLYMAISGVGSLTDAEKAVADLTGDGIIDMFDALKLYQQVAGI